MPPRPGRQTSRSQRRTTQAEAIRSSCAWTWASRLKPLGAGGLGFRGQSSHQLLCRGMPSTMTSHEAHSPDQPARTMHSPSIPKSPAFCWWAWLQSVLGRNWPAAFQRRCPHVNAMLVFAHLHVRHLSAGARS